MLPHQLVAAEVRAELARRQLSGVRAARELGWSQNYISRRLSGTVPFDVADLAQLAEFLDVPIGTFFRTSTGVKTTMTSSPGNFAPLGLAA